MLHCECNTVTYLCGRGERVNDVDLPSYFQWEVLTLWDPPPRHLPTEAGHPPVTPGDKFFSRSSGAITTKYYSSDIWKCQVWASRSRPGWGLKSLKVSPQESWQWGSEVVRKCADPALPRPCGLTLIIRIERESVREREREREITTNIRGNLSQLSKIDGPYSAY